MKRILRTLYSRSGWITRPLYGGVGQIVMLHRITPARPGMRIQGNAAFEITPERLEEIIAFFIGRDCDILSPDQLPQRLADRKNRKAFVLFTFDDGYKDTYLHAYPLFQKYRIPFAVYIATGFPDGTALHWEYSLEDLILERDSIRIPFKNGERTFECDSLKDKEDAFREIRAIILNASLGDYDETVRRIFEPFGLDVHGKTAELLMDWTKIEQLASDPLVTLGAHSVHHRKLSRLSPGEVTDEILGSKQRLESILGRDVHHFAYPFGGRGEAERREFDIAKSCGFKTAVTSRFACLFPEHRRFLHCLPRISVLNTTDQNFLREVVSGSLPGKVNRFKRVITE